MSQISILGCGWLGLPLAVSLQRIGYNIKGSTTSPEKINVLNAAGISPFLIQLDTEKTIGDVNNFLQGSRTLIINVPLGMRGDSSELFSRKMEKFIPFIQKSKIENVLFVSSTSVFGDNQGIVDENTIPVPDSFSGKDLLITETLFNSISDFKTTIIRFGGLIGEDRHPINQLSGKTHLKGGNTPVNLIHRNDCIGLIERIIVCIFWGKIVHGVFPSHPSKKEYYATAARLRKLTPPKFDEENQTTGKTVHSNVLLNKLEFEFMNEI